MRKAGDQVTGIGNGNRAGDQGVWRPLACVLLLGSHGNPLYVRRGPRPSGGYAQGEPDRGESRGCARPKITAGRHSAVAADGGAAGFPAPAAAC